MLEGLSAVGHQLHSTQDRHVRMEVEEILFGLSSLVDSCEAGDIKETFVESYATLLDQLAIKLRDETVREHSLIQVNLDKLVATADYLVVNNEKHRRLSLEMIRVLANLVADVDANRAQLITNKPFIKHLETQLQDNFDDEELNERIYILLKNLVTDSSHIAADVSVITNGVLINVGYNESFMGISVLADLVPNHNYISSVKLVEQIIGKLARFAQSQDDYDEEEYPELMVDMSCIVEQITQDSRLDWNDEHYEQNVQLLLINVLKVLEPMEFANKLTVQRRIYAASGNVSANPSAKNKVILDHCIELINTEYNGYILGIAFCLIGNYISSAQQREETFEKDPKIITHVLAKYTQLVDPIQFQGILHILKNLVSLGNVEQMFTQENITPLSALIEATVRNSRYYTNFTQLLLGFLKKTLVLITKHQLHVLIETNILQSLLSGDSNYGCDIIFLLLLNKMGTYQTETTVMAPLIERVLEFPNARITDLYVFEMTKTLGVLLQHQSAFMLGHHSADILKFIESCPSTTSVNGEVVPQVAYMVENNLKYICTEIVMLARRGSEVEPQLLRKAESMVIVRE